jgi:hypothetical protein
VLEAVRVTCFKYVAAILEIIDLSLSLHSLFYTEPSSEIQKLCQNCVGKNITRTVFSRYAVVQTGMEKASEHLHEQARQTCTRRPLAVATVERGPAARPNFPTSNTVFTHIVHHPLQRYYQQTSFSISPTKYRKCKFLESSKVVFLKPRLPNFCG